MTPTSNSTSPKPRRRWFRFSLRTFLILIAIFAIPLGWCVNKAERQRRAVAFIKSNGGTATYDLDDMPWLDRYPRATWFRRWLPDDYVCTLAIAHVESIDELPPATEIPNLNYLYVYNNKQQDLTPIGGLRHLISLDLSFASGPQLEINLDPLSNIGSLNYLTIKDAYSIRSLDSLASLQKMSILKLNFRASRQIDLSPLAQLTNLTDMDLVFDGGEPITDFSPLRGLTNLEHLNLCGNSGLADLRPLSELKMLKHLNLEKTRVHDLRPLSSLESLETLNLSRTKVTDLSPLSSLTKLEWLELGTTNVTEIEDLKGLNCLRFVLLAETNVSPEKVNSLQRALPTCRIIMTYDY